MAKAIYEYSDFGEVEAIVEAIDNEICYTGAIYDASTGLHYMNARYYDPSNGRFISQDTYRGELTSPGQWHLYVYCANNPINYTDPSGHDLVLSALSAAAGLMLVISYMTTPQFKIAWNEFCNSVGNGLTSIGGQLKNGLLKVSDWSKSYINRVITNVKEFTVVAAAQGKINDCVRNKSKGAKYYEAYMKKSGKYSFIAIGKSLTSTKARKRIAVQSNVFAVSKSYARKLANNFTGVVGPEIDNGKSGKFGYYWHYHVQKRKNKAHIWYV